MFFWAKRNYLAVFLISALVLTGCASVMGQKFQEASVKQDTARIYIYRPWTMVGGAVSYPVYINGEKIFQLPHTAYYVYYADPGEVFITAKTLENEASVKLRAEAGKTYYIKGGTSLGQFAGRATLAEVHPNTGKKEIVKCKYYPNNDFLNKDKK